MIGSGKVKTRRILQLGNFVKSKFETVCERRNGCCNVVSNMTVCHCVSFKISSRLLLHFWTLPVWNEKWLTYVNIELYMNIKRGHVSFINLF